MNKRGQIIYKVTAPAGVGGGAEMVFGHGTLDDSSMGHFPIVLIYNLLQVTYI